jgi:hypothetical protein
LVIPRNAIFREYVPVELGNIVYGITSPVIISFTLIENPSSIEFVVWEVDVIANVKLALPLVTETTEDVNELAAVNGNHTEEVVPSPTMSVVGK